MGVGIDQARQEGHLRQRDLASALGNLNLGGRPRLLDALAADEDDPALVRSDSYSIKDTGRPQHNGADLFLVFRGDRDVLTSDTSATIVRQVPDGCTNEAYACH